MGSTPRASARARGSGVNSELGMELCDLGKSVSVSQPNVRELLILNIIKSRSKIVKFFHSRNDSSLYSD